MPRLLVTVTNWLTRAKVQYRADAVEIIPGEQGVTTEVLMFGTDLMKGAFPDRNDAAQSVHTIKTVRIEVADE